MKVRVIGIKCYYLTILKRHQLTIIRPYLKDIINNLKKSETWKIQLTIVINFIFSKYNDEERLMHSKSYKIEIMINDKADEVIEKLFESFLIYMKLDNKCFNML